jgi:hypothetical protein
MHGAGGGAGSGKAHPNWKHGARSADLVALQKLVNALDRESQNLSGVLDDI